MSPKGTSVQIFGFMSLLLMWTCQAAVQPNVFELILDSLKNIEDMIRESTKPTIYLTSSVGRNVIMNIPHHLPSREVALNVDVYESEELRGHLQRHPALRDAASPDDLRRPQQPSTANWLLSQVSNNENVNFDRRENERIRKQPEDDILPFLIDPASPRFSEKYRRSFGKSRNRDDNSNVNSNVNTNVNTNTNSNSNARLPERGNRLPNSFLRENSGRIYAIGSRSLSRSKDINRNVNRNVNSNTNTNTNMAY